MLEELNLKEILKKNPHIRKEDLESGEFLAEKFRRGVILRRSYQLAPPYARRRAGTNEGQECDPRTINLAGSRH